MQSTFNHIHMRALNKFDLARWYQETLDFKVIADIEALGEENGPLFISGDGGRSGISIFTARDPKPGESFAVPSIPAFEIAPEALVQLFRRMHEKNPEMAVYDHRLFFSIYFLDPSGTKLEFMSMKYAETQALLEREGISSRAINPAVSEWKKS